MRYGNEEHNLVHIAGGVSEVSMRRRQFLGLAGKMSVTLVAVEIATPLRVLAEEETFKALAPAEAATLLAAVHRIVPHARPTLVAAARKTALAIDAKLVGDAAQRDKVRAGLVDLDTRARKVYGKSFASLSAAQQTAVLKAIERTAFFQGLIASILSDFYNRHEVWAAIGYPGPSMNIGRRYLGGYINKGFNKWFCRM
jgi:predicted house-cleaning NTP pyrophosphatase (Maf/HAM1 superfamily)